MASAVRSMLCFSLLLPLVGASSMRSDIELPYVVDIYDIDCAEAHGFAISSEGPQSEDDLSAGVGVSFPLQISKRDFSTAELSFYGDEGVLVAPLQSRQTSANPIKSTEVFGSYGAVRRSQVSLYYDDRWMYTLHLGEMIASIGKRGSSSLNKPILRNEAAIERLEGCARHDLPTE